MRESLARHVRILQARHDELRMEHSALRKAHEGLERDFEGLRRVVREQEGVVRQMTEFFQAQQGQSQGQTQFRQIQQGQAGGSMPPPPPPMPMSIASLSSSSSDPSSLSMRPPPQPQPNTSPTQQSYFPPKYPPPNVQAKEDTPMANGTHTNGNGVGNGFAPPSGPPSSVSMSPTSSMSGQQQQQHGQMGFPPPSKNGNGSAAGTMNGNFDNSFVHTNEASKMVVHPYNMMSQPSNSQSAQSNSASNSQSQSQLNGSSQSQSLTTTQGGQGALNGVSLEDTIIVPTGDNSLARLSFQRMNLMSKRAEQGGMRFGPVVGDPSSAVPTTNNAVGETTTLVEPKPVLMGMTREVALQRLQDLARVTSAEGLGGLGGVGRGVLGGNVGRRGRRGRGGVSTRRKRSSLATNGVSGHVKKEMLEDGDPSAGVMGREDDDSADDDDDDSGEDGDDADESGPGERAGDDDDAEPEDEPRVFASQHVSRIPTGAGLKLKAKPSPPLGGSAILGGVGSPAGFATSPPSMYASSGGAAGAAGIGAGNLAELFAAENEAHRGLSVLTVGHLVPRPFLPANFAQGPDGTSNGNGAGAGGTTGTSGGGINGSSWPNAITSSMLSNAAMLDGGAGGMSMDRMPSPPAASPPSLSSTDPRQLVTMEHYPAGIPASLSLGLASGQAPTTTSIATGGGGGGGGPKRLRVHRSTYVPGWAVPPRILLVEDDLVSRRLSSKFLQVSGCTIDVAVDGLGAVSKMELEKYDLVLMVR